MYVQVNNFFSVQFVTIFLSISFNIMFIETVLLSTDNICFPWQTRKIIFELCIWIMIRIKPYFLYQNLYFIECIQ